MRGHGLRGLRKTVTEGQRELRALVEAEQAADDGLEFDERPTTRGECIGGVRPCPYVSCRQNLYLDVNPYTGSIKINFPDLDIDQIPESCALDVADRGGLDSLDEIGRVMNMTRERVRQIESSAIRKLWHIYREDDE
jgi:hypothetical protein